jgi:hypothetical protein
VSRRLSARSATPFATNGAPTANLLVFDLESPPLSLTAEPEVLSAFARGDFAFGRQENRIRSQIAVRGSRGQTELIQKPNSSGNPPADGSPGVSCRRRRVERDAAKVARRAAGALIVFDSTVRGDIGGSKSGLDLERRGLGPSPGLADERSLELDRSYPADWSRATKSGSRESTLGEQTLIG